MKTSSSGFTTRYILPRFCSTGNRLQAKPSGRIGDDLQAIYADMPSATDGG